jgi:carbamate kinase
MTIAVVALGGNAILRSNEKGTAREQINHVNESVRQLNVLFKKYDIVITHGNGPQVGNLLIQQERARDKIPPMPLDVCGAMTQGQIGYFLQMSLRNILKKSVTTVVTQILVDKKDPAFRKPTKPIGPYYPKKIFKDMIKEDNGWRRVVPSPKPQKIIEIEGIKDLVKIGVIVITCGGGGIPVVMKNGKLTGVEAVIDKDYASQKLATALKAETLIILTDIDYVYLNYGENNQKPLKKITVKEAIRLLKEGYFKEGSMKPKIEASIEFLRRGGKKVIITELSSLKKALKNKAGTIITHC